MKIRSGEAGRLWTAVNKCLKWPKLPKMSKIVESLRSCDFYKIENIPQF
jgi:hypothetical protein